MLETIGNAIGTALGIAILAAPVVGVVLLVRRYGRRGRPSPTPRPGHAPSSDTMAPAAPTTPSPLAPPVGPPVVAAPAPGSASAGAPSTGAPATGGWGPRIRASLRPRYGTPRTRRILALAAVAALVVLNLPDVQELANVLPGTGDDMATAGSSGGGTPGGGIGAGGGGPSAPAAGTVTLRDPGGVSLTAPSDWRLDPRLAASVTAAYGADRSGMVAVVSPDTEVLVWPLFIPGTASPPEPSVILDGYVARLLPTAGLPLSLTLDDRTATTSGRSGDRDVAASLVMSEPSGAGTAAMLAIVRSSDLIAASDTVADVLASVRVQGAPLQDPPAGALTFTRVMASDEPAFTVEVPSEWSGAVTLERRSGTVFNPTVTLRSPDGATSILWSGATGSPLFELYAITGLFIHPEGATWAAVDGTTRIIRSPQPAEVLARESLPSIAEWVGCGTPEVTDVQARPDLAAAVAEGWSAWVARADYDAVELRFRCGGVTGVVRTITEYVGYAMSDPTISVQPQLWGVKQYVASIAAPGAEATAELVVARLYESFAFDPAWYGRQLGLQAGLSDIVTNAGRQMSDIVSRGYEGRQDVYDALSQRRSEAIRGVERVEDTITGATYEVESGSGYYWIDDRGSVVGTDVSTAPTVDFRALARRW